MPGYNNLELSFEKNNNFVFYVVKKVKCPIPALGTVEQGFHWGGLNKKRP